MNDSISLPILREAEQALLYADIMDKREVTIPRDELRALIACVREIEDEQTAIFNEHHAMHKDVLAAQDLLESEKEYHKGKALSVLEKVDDILQTIRDTLYARI